MSTDDTESIRVGEFTVWPETGAIVGPSGSAHVHPKAMQVLRCLVARAGQVVEHRELMLQVWGDGSKSNDSLSHCISELRHAFEDHVTAPAYIQTHPKVGYELIAQVAAVSNTEPAGKPPDESTGFWTELRRRKVVKTAVAYLAGSWLVLQVVAALTPPLPEELRTIVVAIGLLGLPIVVALAWAYDVTVVSDSRGGYPEVIAEFLKRNISRLIVAGSTVAVVLAASILIQSQPTFSFTAGSAVVFTFKNNTDDASLGSALREAFRIALGQSPFARVTSPDRVDEALARMGKPPGVAIDRATAQEIAIREGFAAVVAGTVSRVGDSYIILAEIVNPSNKAIIYSDSQSTDSDGLLKAIQKVATNLRKNLGESMKSVTETSGPLDQVSTPNLQALRAFSLAKEKKNQYQIPEAKDLLKEAIKLDPQFAFAHAELGTLIYGDSENKTQAFEEWHLALSFPDRLSQREKLHIEALLASHSPPDEVLRRWSLLTSLYPEHPVSYTYSGRTYWYAKNDFELASRSYTNAVNRGGTWLSVYRNAYCVLGTGDMERATSEFLSAYNRAGHYYNYGLADAYIASRKYQLAEDILAPIVSKGLTNRTIDAHEKLVALYIDRGQFTNAIQALDQMKSFLGAGRSSLEKLDDAMARLALLQHVEPQTAYTETLIGAIALLPALYLDATRNQTLPPVAETALLGKLAARSSQLFAADALLDRLGEVENLELFPLWKALRLVLKAEILIAQGEPQAAVTILQEAVQAGDLYQAHESLAYAYEQSGQLKPASVELDWLISHRGQAFAEYMPNFFGREHSLIAWASAHYRSGQILEQRGRPRAAKKHYNILISHWSKSDVSIRLRDNALRRVRALSGAN